jgi:NAD+ diphosphatase
MSSSSFVSLVSPPEEETGTANWFIFSGSHLLIQETEAGVQIPQADRLSHIAPTIAQAAIRQLYLGHLDGVHCFGVEVPRETAVPDTFSFQNLRALFMRIPDELLTLAGRALQIVDWDRTHQFCSRCGTEVEHSHKERVKRCPNCDYSMYPRLAPAIIVRVQRQTGTGPQILLARGPNYPPGWYSVLAGFVEPGETLEECVEREVFEEVGIKVKNIRYFGSQPWPFPHSLMLGFTADYESGEFNLQEEEIEEAKWFSKGNIPKIPPRMSISRHLIDDFLDNTTE